MKSRKAIVMVVTACILALKLPGTCRSQVRNDSYTSDIWWIHTESGWGIQFVQNNNTIFATPFVDGPDNQPTWYAAIFLNYQGSFNPGVELCTRRPGPGLVLDHSTPLRLQPHRSAICLLIIRPSRLGTLIYSVNGVQVLKTIERQLLVYEDFNGTMRV